MGDIFFSNILENPISDIDILSDRQTFIKKLY